MSDKTIYSNKYGRLKKKEALEALRLERTPGISKSEPYQIKQYQQKKGDKIYSYYKLKKGRRLVKDGSVTYKKMLCVGLMSNSSSKGHSESRRIYIIFDSNKTTENELEHIVSQIAFRLKTQFKSPGPWGDEPCSGSATLQMRKVLIQYIYDKKRVYGFGADVRKVGETFTIYNQRPLDKKSGDLSRDNDITGDYRA